jgi:hypothetical protein
MASDRSRSRIRSTIWREDRLASFLWLIVLACAGVILLASPGKVHVRYTSGFDGGGAGYSTGAASWGVWAFLAAIAAFIGVGIALVLLTTVGHGWPALGLAGVVVAFAWIGEFSWDYRSERMERAPQPTNYTVVSFGPSGLVAIVGVIGAIAATLLAIWTIREAFRKRPSN